MFFFCFEYIIPFMVRKTTKTYFSSLVLLLFLSLFLFIYNKQQKLLEETRFGQDFMFKKAREGVMKQTHGNYPAPLKVKRKKEKKADKMLWHNSVLFCSKSLYIVCIVCCLLVFAGCLFLFCFVCLLLFCLFVICYCISQLNWAIDPFPSPLSLPHSFSFKQLQTTSNKFIFFLTIMISYRLLTCWRPALTLGSDLTPATMLRPRFAFHRRLFFLLLLVSPFFLPLLLLFLPLFKNSLFYSIYLSL